MSVNNSSRDHARALRDAGHSFEEIGLALGITRQGAQYLCRGDGSGEVRVVLSGEIMTRLDAWRAGEFSRPEAIVFILKKTL